MDYRDQVHTYQTRQVIQDLYRRHGLQRQHRVVPTEYGLLRGGSLFGV